MPVLWLLSEFPFEEEFQGRRDAEKREGLEPCLEESLRFV